MADQVPAGQWICGLCVKNSNAKLDGKHRATVFGTCQKCGTTTDLHKVK